MNSVLIDIGEGVKLSRPDGLDSIIRVFGDPRPFIKEDGTIDPQWEEENIVRVDLPAPIPYAGTHVTRVACHSLAACAATKAFGALYDAGAWATIKDYGGGYAPRTQRLSTHLSAHMWGIAFDLNVRDLPLGSFGNQPPEIMKAFTDAGFYYGGLFHGRRRDPQHWQLATNY